MLDRREGLLRLFKQDRFLAHRELFAHRHKDESPQFHKDIVTLFNSDDPRVALMAFRGGAKSTLLEEDVLLKALFREINYCIIVGPKWESACEHVEAIRNEIEMNDAIMELFGDQKASPWSSGEIQLANGVKIKAIGAGQAMRGTKSNNERPDYAAIDDLEDEENIRTPEALHRTERWLVGTMLPALHPTNGKVRFIGTPLHPKALITKKCEDAKWASKIFPISYIDVDGIEQSTWPSRFPMPWIEELRDSYVTAGNLIEYNQEYMCRAEDVAGKPFQASMIKVQAVQETFFPIEIAIDPARTVKERSARTAYVAGSWIGNQLLVHEAVGKFHKPDEIISTVFEWNARFRPVHIYVEANALDEFITQPLRNEALKRGISLPIVPVYAPKSKDDFIRGLQPLYMSGSVIHAKSLPDLESELIQFPTGRKDVPNALAYFLRMRAGRPVYEDFNIAHVAPVLEVHPTHPRWLLVSSRPAITTALLIQYVDGMLRVYQDWVLDRPPVEAFPLILREAIMAGEGQVKIAAPVEQFDTYLNNGLPAAARRDNINVVRMAAAQKSEGALKSWLSGRERNEPMMQVAQQARWTLNGLACGYSRRLDKYGRLENFTAENQYKVLIEAFESFVNWFDSQRKVDTEQNIQYARTRDGRRYITSLPNLRI